MKRLAAIFILLLAGNVNAQLSFSGEALYWRPTGDHFDYAVQVNPTRARTFTLASDYDWGVRLGALWSDQGPCFATDFYGLFIRFLDVTDTAAGNLLLPFATNAAQTAVHASLKLEHWAAGFRVRRYLHHDECLGFYLTAGARFATVNEWRAAKGDVPALTQETLKFRGGGPEVGAGGSWRLWRCLDLLGSINVAPIIGERKSRLFFVDSTSTFARTLFPNSTVIVPMVEAKLALSYQGSLRRYCFAFDVGYEIDHYWNALIPVFEFLTTTDPAQARRPEDIGFAGPYLRLTLGF